MKQYAIWQRTLAPQGDSLDPQRAILSQAFLEFRDQVKHLVGEIAGLLPDLTVHDITHLDALWRVADQIAGPNYPLNPAEAFVLGGSFLLHDAAHVLAAYENRVQGVKESIDWKDLVAQHFEGNEPATNSPDERFALFHVLRHLHAAQAHKLLKISWKAPGTDEELHLLPNFHLREYYGDLIGEIAESHHWPADRLADEFGTRRVGAPGFLAPAMWEVDALKVACLLRTSDAAHIDGQRAPWFLFALRQPQGISDSHWRFQAKMGQPALTTDGELRLSSGSPFSLHERNAWWLAFDTARLIDRELRDAKLMMKECGRMQFAAGGVTHVATPTSFSADVRTSGWEPVHVEPAIRDVSKIIANFGGAKLYGDKPELALRELIQNAVDAVRASRTMDHLGHLEGEIEIALGLEDGQCWLHITDHGIGMSRYVLTEVLPDFGNSLWGSERVRSEIPGLVSRGFKAIGQFGIGFYSVFMLGAHVRVTTRRFRKAISDSSDQWILEFENRLSDRPTLRKPKPSEELSRAGTRVSVAIGEETLKQLVSCSGDVWRIDGLPPFGDLSNAAAVAEEAKSKPANFKLVVANLCPTLDIKVSVRIGSETSTQVILPNDWETLPTQQLHARLALRVPQFYGEKSTGELLDLREPTGMLVGRVGYKGGYFARAQMTHKGIRSGTIPKIVGVVLGHNNADLARSAARPLASLTAWKSWAEQWLILTEDSDVEMMTTLHPLCPDEDLPVYELNGDFLTEAALRTWLATVGVIKVLVGIPTHEDADDMSESKFNANFQAGLEILFLPKRDKSLGEKLGAPEISYSGRFTRMLNDVWGNFEVDEFDDEIVGDVNGFEIARTIEIYSQPAAIDIE